PLWRLASLWQDSQQARTSGERLGDTLNTPPEAPALAGRSAMPRLKGRVTLESVTFRYRREGAAILHDVSLDVPVGQIVGIVGPSGPGKSTPTQLLPPVHLPRHGRPGLR